MARKAPDCYAYTIEGEGFSMTRIQSTIFAMFFLIGSTAFAWQTNPSSGAFNGAAFPLAQRGLRPTSDVPKAEDIPDDKAEKFIPAKPLTVAQANAVEAQKLYVLGLAHLRNRRLSDALETFRQALVKDPDNLATLHEIVPLAFQMDKADEAMNYCIHALKLEPTNSNFLRILALRSLAKGDRAAAIDAFEKACSAPNARKENPAAYLEMKMQLAQLYDVKKDAAKVAQTMGEVVDLAEKQNVLRFRGQLRQSFDRDIMRYRESYIRALIAARKFDDAETQLTKAMKNDSGKRLGIFLVEALFEQGKYQAAFDELSKYRRLQMLEEHAPVLLEKILDKLNRGGDFLKTLEEWVRDDRSNPVLRRVYGQRLMAAKRYQEAREQLSQISDKPEALPLLARLFREMNDPDALLETLARSINAADGARSDITNRQIDNELQAIANDKELLKKIAASARTPKKTMQIEPFVLNLLIATIAKTAKEIDLAREFYDRCIKERGRPEDYEEVINLLFDAEKYGDAESYCRKALVRDPDEFSFQDLLVRCISMKGKPEEAIAVAQAVVDKTIEREVLVRALLTLSWAFQNADKLDKAAATIQRVLEQYPENQRAPFARYMLANIFTQKGDNQRAEEQLQKLVDGDVEKVGLRLRATANNDLGYMWADRGHNLDKAEAMVRKALEIEPDNGAYLDSLGWLLFKRGRHAEAKGYLEKAVKQHEDGNDPVIWDHLGDACLQLGDKAAAKKSWDKAFELFVKQKKSRDKNGEKARDVKRKIDGLNGPAAAVPVRAGKDDP